MLVHGATPDAESRLFIELESLDPSESGAFEARFEEFPACEGISELCYRVSLEALEALQVKYGLDGFLTPR